MKERPILFSGQMVRAILGNRKMQTRRVVKLPESLPPVAGWEPNGSAWKGVGKSPEVAQQFISTWPMSVRCPYGTVGDRLWVREAWGLWDTLPKDGPERARIFYRSTDSDLHECRHQLWRPSIHMPRWASRITLEITGVRVERLQEISEKDAIAEGCICPNYGIDDYWKKAGDPDTPADVFMELWQSINGPESWSANPWVWVIEFKRLETA